MAAPGGTGGTGGPAYGGDITSRRPKPDGPGTACWNSGRSFARQWARQVGDEIDGGTGGDGYGGTGSFAIGEATVTGGDFEFNAIGLGGTGAAGTVNGGAGGYGQAGSVGITLARRVRSTPSPTTGLADGVGGSRRKWRYGSR